MQQSPFMQLAPLYQLSSPPPYFLLPLFILDTLLQRSTILCRIPSTHQISHLAITSNIVPNQTLLVTPVKLFTTLCISQNLCPNYS